MSRGGGGKISVRGLRGWQVFSTSMPRGASFQCAGISEFLRPPLPVPINTDRSLRAHYASCKGGLKKLENKNIAPLGNQATGPGPDQCNSVRNSSIFYMSPRWTIPDEGPTVPKHIRVSSRVVLRVELGPLVFYHKKTIMLIPAEGKADTMPSKLSVFLLRCNGTLL